MPLRGRRVIGLGDGALLRAKRLRGIQPDLLLVQGLHLHAQAARSPALLTQGQPASSGSARPRRRCQARRRQVDTRSRTSCPRKASDRARHRRSANAPVNRHDHRSRSPRRTPAQTDRSRANRAAAATSRCWRAGRSLAAPGDHRHSWRRQPIYPRHQPDRMRLPASDPPSSIPAGKGARRPRSGPGRHLRSQKERLSMVCDRDVAPRHRRTRSVREFTQAQRKWQGISSCQRTSSTLVFVSGSVRSVGSSASRTTWRRLSVVRQPAIRFRRRALLRRAARRPCGDRTALRRLRMWHEGASVRQQFASLHV